MKKENVIREKSFAFAVRIVNLYKYLCDEEKEYVLSKQVLRSGTSIGANVEESMGGQSDKDFIAKLSIAYKEVRETVYWIKLLSHTDFLSQEQTGSLLQDADELCKIITKILLTMKTKTNSYTKMEYNSSQNKDLDCCFILRNDVLRRSSSQ